MILGGRELHCPRAVAQREKRDLLAVEKILDDEVSPVAPPRRIRPKTCVPIAVSASSMLIATTTPLPAASPSALTTIGAPFALT